MKRQISVIVTMAVVGLVLCGVGSAAAASGNGTAASSYNYAGGAYGSYAYVGGVVKSGPSSPVSTGCGTGPGFQRTLSVAALDASPLFSTGAISSSLTTASASTSASSDVLAAHLLGGLVSASEVKAVSTTTAGLMGNSYSAGGS